MMLRRWLFLVWACLLGAAATVGATDVIPVVKAGAGKSVLNLSSLVLDGSTQHEVFAATLKADLNRSGWFTVTEGADAVIKVSGTCHTSGDALFFDCLVLNTATGGKFLDRRLSGKVDGARVLAHNVADAIVMAVKKIPGIASTRILMIGAQGAAKDLYLCDADGQRFTRVTHDNTVCLSPNWAPDGKRLTYTSYRGNFPDVYSIDIDSGRRERIINYPGLNAGGCISPDGKRLVLTLSKDGNPDIYVVRLGGGGLTRLTRTSNAAEASPSWAPDGSQIVFVSDSSGSPQVYSLSAKGGKPKRVTYRGNENVSPDWGPGSRIVYSSRREGRYQVCVMDMESGEKWQITNDAADYEDPSWAPDGRHIVCSRTEQFRSNLYVLDTLGDAPLRLTTLAGDWYSPDWSPK